MSITIIDYPIKNNPSYKRNLDRADSRYIEFQDRGPLGAVLHSIGTPQPSAKANAEYFNSPAAAKAEVSVHMVLQADGICYRLAPDNYRLWHVGGSANNTHMGIEMTEPDCISYDANNGYKLTIHNRAKALDHVTNTYSRAVDLFAGLCMTHGWNPLKDGVILSHTECYKRGIGGNHGDPEHLWDALKTGYTMDGFRRDVAKEIELREKALLQLTTEDEVKRILDQRDKEVKDNDCSSWSKEARQWAIANGIIQGIGNGPDGKPNYAWEAPITREQMITMLYRFSKTI